MTQHWRTRALVVFAVGTVQVKLPAEAETLAAATLQLAPSSVYSTVTLLSPVDVQVTAWLLPEIQLSPPFGEVTVKPMSGVQSVTAKFMGRNWIAIPHVTHNDDADVTELEDRRARWNAANPRRPACRSRSRGGT